MDNNKSNGLSRRRFLTNSAALAAVSMAPAGIALGSSPVQQKKKVNSNFGGVNIGAITYSWRSMPGGLENIVKYCQECNISSIELMSGDLETFLGAPENPMMAIFRSMPRPAPPAPPTPAQPGEAPAPPPRMRRPQLTPEQQAQIDQYNKDVVAFRMNIDMNKVAAARKLLDDAGIRAHIVKFSPARWSDEEIDYAFKVAKAMGARGVSEELSEEAVNKLAPFAEKHDMYAVFHQHMQFADIEGFSYEPFMKVSPAVMFNFDSGHFFGSTGIHPKEILNKYHDRIFSMHIKDKTGPETDPPNTNQVWGQGQMPLEETLLLIQKEKWPIYCDIELEYDVKPWSNAVKEVTNCAHFARQILI